MGWVDLFATFYPPNTFHWCPLMGGMFDPEMPKLTKRPFPTCPFFGNTYCRFLVTRQEIALLWSLNCNRHKYILHLHKIRNWFATEMQNRCRVQLLAQINIFLLKKEHLSATNQSSSCNYSFDCKFFFFQKVHLSFLFFKKYISLWPIELLVAHINQSFQRSERLQWAKVESKYIFLFWTNICFLWQIYIFLQRHIFSQNKYMFFSGQYITLDICQEE